MSVKNNLREFRTNKGLSQEDLAVAVGTCGRTIGRIERCERNASLEMALKIAVFLNLKVEDIFKSLLINTTLNVTPELY